MDATWRALADPTRRRLIELLRDGPRTTGELCEAFPTTRFAVMKHLGVLEQAGLVVVSREGRKRWNSLNPERLLPIGATWAGAIPGSGIAEGDAPVAADSQAAGADARPARTRVFVDAVPWKVFDALTVNIAAWWGPPHLRSPDASNLVLEAQPGGRFYEEWGHRQGALRGMVTAIRQDERLELRGPLLPAGGDSRLALRLEPREGGTLVTVDSDNVPGDVVDDLFRVRMKGFVENGTRAGVGA